MPKIYNIEYKNTILVTSSTMYDRYIKIYEYVYWKFKKKLLRIPILSYVCLPKDENVDTFIFETMNPWYYSIYNGRQNKIT